VAMQLLIIFLNC